MLLSSLLAAPALHRFAAAGEQLHPNLERSIAALEHRHGGRLGVAVLDTGGKPQEAYRGDERFPLCSTHKFLSAAFILARVDRGKEALNRRIAYPKSSVIAYSPVTSQHAGGDGLTLREICATAMIFSDNTAANLLLDSFGGPAALTAWLRSLGDTVTRLDGHEPELNEFTPGDPRNTTTPLAIAGTMRRIVLGDALSAASRQQIVSWLVACKTGDARLRAGAPKDWRVGDKTGSGPHHATNDIAVLWPTGRAPIVVAAYFIDSDASDDARNGVLAEVGRLGASM